VLHFSGSEIDAKMATPKAEENLEKGEIHFTSVK
jgi:hypothetical protein